MQKRLWNFLHYFRLCLYVSALATSGVQAQQSESADAILQRVHVCSPTLSLRSQALTAEQEQSTCEQLGAHEKRFHQIFAINEKPVAPVKHDNNQSLRANIYSSSEMFAKYAGSHFNMPTNNGGMYLEGTPENADNHAEFVAYQRERGLVHNLGHEYIHYLDGRFNLYGDFCANLHDSHSAPENCALPSPPLPYLIWWTEGVAEYISRGDDNPQAKKAAADNTYRFSQLLDTGYEKNNESARIYTWGYLAVRFMMEKHRDQIDTMLNLTRVGDYPRYQALAHGWGAAMDADFAAWLTQFALSDKNTENKH